jgi:hypothetical protein
MRVRQVTRVGTGQRPRFTERPRDLHLHPAHIGALRAPGVLPHGTPAGGLGVHGAALEALHTLEHGQAW